MGKSMAKAMTISHIVPYYFKVNEPNDDKERNEMLKCIPHNLWQSLAAAQRLVGLL
jgi:hypothetical protein